MHPQESNSETRPQPHDDSTGLSETVTVLLVDDDATLRAIAQRVLERGGYTVLAADSGRAAVEIWREVGAGIQLLLTDVDMPEMNGFQLAETLQAERPTLKVIFSTGRMPQATFGGARLVNGMNLLLKPFTATALTEAVRHRLSLAS